MANKQRIITIYYFPGLRQKTKVDAIKDAIKDSRIVAISECKKQGPSNSEGFEITLVLED